MREYVLDTNIYSNFADPHDLRVHVGSRLRQLAAVSAIRVFGSLNTIEELAGLSANNPDRYGHAVRLFFDLTLPRLLRPWNQLLPAEIRKGSRLTIAEACLTEEMAKSAMQLMGNPKALKELIVGVKDLKRKFANQFMLASDDAADAMASRWVKPQINTFKGRFTGDKRQIEGWFHDLLSKESEPLGLAADRSKWPRIDDLPFCRAFFGIHVALVVANLRENRKYREQDLYDAKHYVHAAASGTLVTADTRLARTSRYVEWSPIRVIDGDRLAHELRLL